MNLPDTYTIAQIASFLNAEYEGNGAIVISGIGRIEESTPGDILFVTGKKFFPFIDSCDDVCILIPRTASIQPKPNQAFIRVDNPHSAFAVLIEKLFPFHSMQASIAQSASIHPDVYLSEDVCIGEGVVIGANCSIGKGTVLHPHVVIAEQTIIGDNCILYPHVVCYAHTVIGNNVIIHAGAVIGSDGFGYSEHSDGTYQKIKHVGNVIIEDDVEIGANTTIDRSVVNSTVIARGVKLDNLVHIAHNVSIGEHSAFAAQVGIAGSAKIGARNRFGGQVGTVGHLFTADDVTVLGQSGIAQNIEQSGIYFGSPAIERSKEMRRIFATQHLPDLAVMISKLEDRIKELEQALDTKKTS